ncbi:MAG TPA: glycosyltransferase, partial [Sphingomonadaceae bacterium]|nr:glycosyltransferase [Sphingomonadaceae bacterium]
MPKREAAGERADVAVVIVNYGTAELAISGVESVLAHHHGGRHVTVHLIDNASPGDDAALLAETYRERAWSDRVTLYQEPINHGFGRGNNIVLRTLAALAHPPDKVMLLNPDARLTTETVAALADCLDAHPHAAVAGAGINRPGGEAVAAAFRFPSLAGEFAGSVRSRFTDRLFAHWLVA